MQNISGWGGERGVEMVENGWVQDSFKGLPFKVCEPGPIQMRYEGRICSSRPGLPGEGRSGSRRHEERQGRGSSGGMEAGRQRACRGVWWGGGSHQQMVELDGTRR